MSGSMRNAYALDRSHDASVERTHAIFTTVMNIVKKEVTHHNRQESIFVGAFGLDPPETETCDLLSLLDYVDEILQNDGHDGLVRLAAEVNDARAEPWIRKHLSKTEAQILYSVLRDNKPLTKELTTLIPWRATGGVLKLSFWAGLQSEQQTVKDSDAFKRAKEIIDDKITATLQGMKQPQPRSVRSVSDMMDKLLQSKDPSSESTQSSSLHKRIQELIEPMKPFIFGGTPMRKALTDTMDLFRRMDTNIQKVLFILSDGDSADGDPYPIAQVLHDWGVTIVSCFLTSDHIPNSKCLFDPNNKFQDKGRQKLFEISSTMHNTDEPVSYLVDANWELPVSGESRLFIQANSLDVVDEFCKIVVSQMTSRSCDAIVHMLEKLPLATYINQQNADFKPQEQKGGTCYANAIAAVFHLAMHRIVGREGGIPDFYQIRDRLIHEYGVAGANTERVLAKVCPEYRLQYKKVDETGARQAINKRRPVVARFSLYDKQWEKFSAFYRKTPKKILSRQNVEDPACIKPGGHAVVLTRCDPECLTFMNSWGDKFGDGGFFRVEDQNVLNDTKFFDVYWTLADLKPSEKQAYERKCTERAQQLSRTFPSIQELPYECPKCKQNSKVGEFLGHILEAKCPKCSQTFTPNNKEILQSLYTRNFNRQS